MTEKKKELLFSVTKDDCDWSYTKGTGAGGQKRNKTSSAVHCKHRASGAMGYSEASRSQLDNKRDAFVKMVNTPEFQKWHKIEVWKKLGVLKEIEQAVASGMDPRNLKIEIKKDDKWVEIGWNDPLDVNEIIDSNDWTVS